MSFKEDDVQSGIPFVALLTAVAANSAAAVPPTIVIGFVGGRVSRDNSFHSGVQIADHLRADRRADVYTEVFENRRREEAHRRVLRLLDTDHDGKLSPKEKSSARIILYGHSWGASAVVLLARQLEQDGIPVLLTVQVDSIRKPGQEDSIIPANVTEAANLYQPHGLVHGRSQIRAADPSRTVILGNFRYDYEMTRVACPDFQRFPLYARLLWSPHLKIECDPTVSDRVESLVRSKLDATD